MEILFSVLSSSAVASIVSGIFTLISNKQKKESGTTAGVRILLYDRIKHLGTHYINRGWVSEDELEDLIKMHDIYHTALNGNGFLKALMLKVKELPNHPPKEDNK